MLPSLAVIVRFPAVVVLVTVPVYTPLPWSVIEPPEDNVTVSPETRLPFASVTVAVAVAVEVPFATIDVGFKDRATFAAGPGVWVSVAGPETLPSIAVIVRSPAVVVLVTVAE